LLVFQPVFVGFSLPPKVTGELATDLALPPAILVASMAGKQGDDSWQKVTTSKLIAT
jgi:hypothetical protein